MIKLLSILLCALALPSLDAFVVGPSVSSSNAGRTGRPLTRHALFPEATDLLAAAATTTAPTTSSLLLAETEAWVQPLANVLDPSLNFFSFCMLARVVLSWYPTTVKLLEFPWIIVVVPTEPLLRLVKGVIPPAFGVDITPIFWLGIFTFIHEILLGQQGLLILKLKYGI